MYNTILVPLDGSTRAERILPNVEALAEKFGSQIILFQVVEPIVTGSSPYEAGALFVTEEIERRTEEATTYLTNLQNTLTAKGLTANIQVEYGPVVPTLLEVADRLQADLVAMASHGRTGLARVFYGSVAAGILNRIEHPLLVIRAQEE
jgi:nucleotide-binding universal stress UspA family protein